jgi:putative ABC transport system ATP-binding protein
MLKMQNVSKSYRHRGQTVNALDNATLQIARGDFVSVVGPSGSGKSTLLLMLGGMLSPSEGRVLLEDESLYDMNPSTRARLRRDKVGFVFQTFNLVPYLSALENVQVPLFLAKMAEVAQRDRATSLLERVGLADRLHHKPCELSVGQQQRVALARMLANDPAVILADEPTGNLDPDTSRQVIGFLEEFNREGRTIVMVTHDPRAARRAKRLLKLNQGAIVSENVVDGCEKGDPEGSEQDEDEGRDAA